LSTQRPETSGRKRILLADADAGRSLRVRALLAASYDVREPGGVEETLRAARERRADLVLAGVEGGGLELLRALRADAWTADLPVILLARPGGEHACAEALESGADDALAEPFPPRALVARVAARLAAARARREAGERERELLAEAAMATEALERSEERFRAFLNNSPASAWITDEEGRFSFLSEPYTRMFGIDRETAIGKSIFELFPKPYSQTFYDNVRAVAETSGALETVEDAPRPDGTVGHFLVYKFPVRDESGRLLVGGVAADITEHRRAEEAVRQSEERFRLALEAVSGLVYDWDIERDHSERSQGLLNLLGYRPEEVAAELSWWRRQVHPEDFEARNQQILSVLETGGSSFSVEYRVRHRDGRWIDVWDKGLVVRDGEGRPVRVVGSVIDVSDRKRAEEEMRKAKEAAEVASQAKDHFLATLSHELRTPLTPVLAVVSSLERDLRLQGEIRSELAMIRRNVELEARLIDDLLDLTRIARGKLTLRRAEMDARQALEHAFETAAPELESKGIRLVSDLGAADHHVWADTPRLTQVFWNLLNNAVKFTPSGGTVSVQSRLQEAGPDGRELVVEVSDTGIGIEPELLPRIFHAFEQADRGITRKFGGLGLGLAVSRAIIELHGGRLTAASEGLGRGATFEVRLPVGPRAIDLDETAVAFRRVALRPPPPPTAPPSRGLSLLLVEDHADTAAAMADLLELMGHRVTVAGTVASALATAESGGFDLVVSDLGLPDGTGQDLMRELVRRHGLKGIALSGYGMEEDVRKSLEAGFETHLTKPVDFQALKTALEQAATRLVKG
jgi:PAS domain S-box-containing protein